MQFRRRVQRAIREQEADLPPSVPMRLDAPVRGALDVTRPHRYARGGSCPRRHHAAHLRHDVCGLTGFTDLVPLGGYFVAEDGCVDVEEMRLDDSWPRGVPPAVADWLDTPGGRRFKVRRDIELYGMSCHPGGFLQRVR